MAGNKKPRKAYRPRAALPTDGWMKLVRCGVSKMEMTDEGAGELELVALTALDIMTKGQATENEWNSLARAINHAWVMAKNGIGAEIMPTLTQAEAGMKRAEARFKAGKTLGLDAEGLVAVRETLALWGEQLRMCKVGEVDAATRLVEREYWRKAA